MDIEKLYIPVGNLQLKNDSLTLGESQIVRTEEVLGDFARQVLGIDFTVCTPLVKDTDDLQQSMRRTLDRVVLALKLFKDKVAFAQSIFSEKIACLDRLPHYVYFRGTTTYDQDYVIEKEEEQEFVEHFQSYIDLDPRLSPIRLFNLADYRPFLEERFLDYVIAMDGLLIPGESSSTSKFVNHGLSVLKQNPENAQSDSVLKEELKEVYVLRHAMVHGDYEQKVKILQEKSWHEWVPLVRSHTRYLIRYFHGFRIINDSNQRKLHIANLQEEGMS